VSLRHLLAAVLTSWSLGMGAAAVWLPRAALVGIAVFVGVLGAAGLYAAFYAALGGSDG
jgi:hypothetical protein